MYVSESGTTLTLQNAVDHLDVFISGLKHNEVNSTAALQIKPYHGDCLPYPFMVLVEATSLATALPAVFHENNFLSMLTSVLNKDAYLQMGRFKTKNRLWSLLVANVGTGKSMTLDVLRKACEESCKDVGGQYTVGFAADGFHYMESSSHATAREKARFCNGYLCLAIADVSRNLDRAQARGRSADKGKLDLEFYLDAAHGQQISHQNMKDREAFAKHMKEHKVPNPADPHAPVKETEMRETKATFALTCVRTISS